MLETSFAAVLIAAAMAAILLTALYRPARNLALAMFGAATVLYGVRIVANLPDIRLVVPGGDPLWDEVGAICTYLLPGVALVFTEDFFGAGRYAASGRSTSRTPSLPSSSTSSPAPRARRSARIRRS